MIPERTAIEVTSTVQGEDVAMTIDEAAIQHLMNVLTDLYEDPILACIREYSTNALDSHVEAGQTRPIEVATPTELRPLFTVRDYGVGLNAEDIRNIYSRYGASTKRASNDAVGMLGLGCKSALAYCDQFTLCGIKDGHRILVSIARDETGAGTMTVLESGETDEPNGVEVCIPATADSEFEAKAVDFFAYWQPGLVRLNGQAPDELSGYRVGESYIVADRVRNAWDAEGRHDYRPRTIVMGNVSYPPPDGFQSDAVDTLPADKRLVVTVPIGAVHFTPSREGLQDSERTRSAIHSALEDFQSQVGAAVTEAIEGAPDRPAAARALIEARAAFGKANVPELEWEGEEIPVVLSAEDLDPITDEGKGKERAASLWASKIVSGYNGGEAHRYPAGQISLDAAGRNPWVLGYRNTKWTATQRRKLNRYLTEHGLHDNPREATVFITDGKAVPRPEWIDGAVTAVDWQTVREWKDPLNVKQGGSGGTVYAGTYPAYYDGWRTREKFPAEELAERDQRKVFYVEGDKWAARSTAAARILGEGSVVVCLASTRAAKFKRLFPDVRDAVPIVTAAVEGQMAGLSELELAALEVEGRVYFPRNCLSAIPPETLADPELAKAAEILAIVDSGRLTTRSEDWFYFVSRPNAEDVGTEHIGDVLDPYALLNRLHAYEVAANLEHIILYVNAVYAAKQNEEV